MPSFREKGRFVIQILLGAVLVSGFHTTGLSAEESVLGESGLPEAAPSEAAPVPGSEADLPSISEFVSEFFSEDPSLGEIPMEKPRLPAVLFAPSGENPAVEAKPPVELTLLEAIRTALKGNRRFLDRVDGVREGFGIGEVDLDREVSVLNEETGETSLVTLVGETSGVAATQTQFQTSISPSVGFSRRKAEGGMFSGSESYGLSLSKRFQTGGNLSLSSSLSTREFEDPGSSMRVSFSQPLLRNAGPLVVLEPVTNAKSELRQQEIALECCDLDSRQGLIFEVIVQYLSILNEMELVVIAERAVERSKKLNKATAAKLSVELATQLDLSRAEVQLSGQRNALNQARQDLGNLEEAFKVLLGMDTRDRIILTDQVALEEFKEDDISEADLERFVDVALQNRADLIVSRIKVKDAKRKLRISKRGFLPNLNSSFGYSVSNFAGFQNDSDPNESSWNANLSLSYPLPLRGPKINLASRTVALKREKRKVIEKSEEIVQQIKTNIRNVVRGQVTIEIVSEEITGAERKLKIANFRFRRGLDDNFDVVDAENNVIIARQRLTRAIIALKVARARLKKDMGVLNHEG